MDRMKELAREILAEAKAQGAEYAQCSVSEGAKKEFNVDGGRFSLMRTLFNRNVTITLLKGQRKGTVQINKFEKEAVKNAVSDAIAAAESGKPDEAWEFAKEPVEKEFVDGAPECDTDQLFMRTKEVLENIKEKHPKILMEQMITEHTSTTEVYLNTNGVNYVTKSGAYNFSFMYSAHEGEKSTSFYGSDITLKTLDKPVLECGQIDWEFSMIEKGLDPISLDGKFSGPVILAPMALYEIVLGTVMSNFVGDMCIIDGTSIWKDKLGEQVADPRLSVSFEPYNDDVVVMERHTSEGYETENFDLIKNGKLNSFCLSQYAANKTGKKRSGNAGRNIHVAAGDKTLDEIIKGIDKGLLVMRFSGGQPAASGEYSGVAKNSFLVEGGKITAAISETMISGCVPEMLKNIRDISKDIANDGSNSLPFVCFDGITISGK